MRKIAVCLSVLSVLAVAVADVRAQQFGQQTGTGRSTFGGTTTSGVFGQTQRGGVTSQRQSNFARGTGSAAGGLGGATSNPLANLGGADSMLAGRQQTQGSFVGRGAEDLGRFIGAANAMNQAQGGGRDQFGGNQFGGNQFGRNQFGTNQSGRGQNGQFGQFGEGFDNQAAEQLQVLRRFRTKLAVGFEPPAARMTALTAASTARLSKSLERSVGAAVQVQLADAVVVLTGTVPTTAEKMLAEQLALLEPGVARVQNELVVAADTPSDGQPSDSSPTGSTEH